MKAIIGKYPRTRINCRILEKHLNKKYGVRWAPYDQYTRYEKFLHLVDGCIQIIYNATINRLIDKRKRKIVVRIDPWDTWNMDITLAHIILPMLKQLKEDMNGSPAVDDEDVPDELKSTAAEPKKNSWDADSNHFKRWDYVLDEMIFAFESNFNDWEDKFTSGKIDHIIVPIDKEGNVVDKENAYGYRWDKGPNDTYTVDKAGMNAYRSRISKGYALFGKYYTGLWN